MEQQPTPISELLLLILFLGSIIYLLGAIFQFYILRRSRKSWGNSLAIVVLTRLLTVTLSLLIWHYWNLPFEPIIGFLFWPAVISELILGPLILKFMGLDLIKKKPVHNNI